MRMKAIFVFVSLLLVACSNNSTINEIQVETDTATGLSFDSGIEGDITINGTGNQETSRPVDTASSSDTDQTPEAVSSSDATDPSGNDRATETATTQHDDTASASDNTGELSTASIHSDTESPTETVPTQTGTSTGTVGDNETVFVVIGTDSGTETELGTWSDAGVLTDTSDGGDGTEAASEVDGGVVTDTETDTVIANTLPASAITHEVDPYGVAPLVGVVKVSHEEILPDEVQRIDIRIAGHYGADDLVANVYPQTQAFQTNFDMSDLLLDNEIGIPVLGLFAGTENEVTFTLYTNTTAFTGSALMDTQSIDHCESEVVTVTIYDEGALEPGWTYLEDRVYDHLGNCRWLGPDKINYKLASGNYLSGFLDERNWLGKRLNHRGASLPDGINAHHDAIELYNGNILFCAGLDDPEHVVIGINGQETRSLDALVLEMDAQTNEICNWWDPREFMDVDRYTLRLFPRDWFHSNTLWHDDSDDSIIVSARHQGILKMTRNGVQGTAPNQGKELVWIFTPHLGMELAGWDGQGPLDTRNYLLTAVDSNGVPYNDDIQKNLAIPDASQDSFHWPMGQHGVRITGRDESKLRFLTYSNQAYIVFDDEDTTNTLNLPIDENDRHTERYSLLVEYEVDEAAMTVRQVWSYGEKNVELFSSLGGSVDLMKQTQNRMVTAVGIDMQNRQENPANPTVMEFSPAGELIYHLDVKNTELLVFKGGRIDLYHPEQ